MSKTDAETKPSKETEVDESENETASNEYRELAIKAVEHFHKREFAESLGSLVKLQEQRPLDARFTHNAAVVEFFISEFKNIAEFESKLNSVCNLGEINLDNIESLDDIRNCCIYFNKAILLYHTMQYSTALRILNKTFSLAESMDEELKRALCFLLIELFLRVHEPDRALSVIVFLEKLLQSDASCQKKENEEDTSNENDSDESSKESLRRRLSLYKCRCYLNLRKIKACELEMEDIMKDCDKEIVVKTGYMSDNWYEARCHNMKCNVKFLQAHLEYSKGAWKSCVEIMSTIPLTNNFSLTGDSIPLTYFNNMGCAHLQMGKPNLASLYYRKALQENENNVKLKNNENETGSRCLFTCGGNKLPEIMYNLGVSLLHSGKPTEAFDCLTLAVQVYHMNPKLWLRLAECCIMVHKNGNERDFDFINKRKDVLEEVIGSGIHRKLILNLNLFENNKYSYDAQSFAIPVVSLEFATLCLRNAFYLLCGPTVDCSPSNMVDTTQILSLKAAVLTCSAYVSLCLGDPIIALNNCKILLSMSSCSNINKLLGHLYIAEAYILLDRIPEALEHLKPDYSNYMLPNDNEPQRPSRPWKPDNSASARAVFQYNLAVVLALKGDLQKAAELLKQVWLTKGPQCEIPVQMISLALYIELSLGHADIARNIIKQNCPQYIAPA